MMQLFWGCSRYCPPRSLISCTSFFFSSPQIPLMQYLQFLRTFILILDPKLCLDSTFMFFSAFTWAQSQSALTCPQTLFIFSLYSTNSQSTNSSQNISSISFSSFFFFSSSFLLSSMALRSSTSIFPYFFYSRPFLSDFRGSINAQDSSSAGVAFFLLSLNIAKCFSAAGSLAAEGLNSESSFERFFGFGLWAVVSDLNPLRKRQWISLGLGYGTFTSVSLTLSHVEEFWPREMIPTSPFFLFGLRCSALLQTLLSWKQKSIWIWSTLLTLYSNIVTMAGTSKTSSNSNLLASPKKVKVDFFWLILSISFEPSVPTNLLASLTRQSIVFAQSIIIMKIKI